MILQYCAASNTSQIVLDSFPYFRNDNIERKLSPEAIRAVALYLIKQGEYFLYFLSM